MKVKPLTWIEREYWKNNSREITEDAKNNKNPRAIRKRKISDEEYLEKITNRDNYNYLYAQK